MPFPVKIKPGNYRYGEAIGLLLEFGGSFQTRHKRTLIVDAEQKRILEEAGLVDANATNENFEDGNGKKKTK